MITGIGPLSAPHIALDPLSVESFRGGVPHGRWPHEPVSFEGKRVAVIAPADAVQAITESPRRVGHLTFPAHG